MAALRPPTGQIPRSAGRLKHPHAPQPGRPGSGSRSGGRTRRPEGAAPRPNSVVARASRARHAPVFGRGTRATCRPRASPRLWSTQARQGTRNHDSVSPPRFTHRSVRRPHPERASPGPCRHDSPSGDPETRGDVGRPSSQRSGQVPATSPPGPHPVHFDQAGDAQDVGACLHLVEIADRQRGGHGLSARRADRFTMDGEGAIGRDGDRCLVTGGCGGRAPYACTIAVTRPTARLASGANPSAPTYWA